MLDEVQVVMEIVPPDEVLAEVKGPFIWRELIFSPVYRQDRVIKYVASWKNIRLEIKYDKLKICNSWHKFYHGNNYGDYTAKDIRETVEVFVAKLGPSFLNGSVSRMAIGCNLACNPQKFYPKCISLGPTFFQEMRMGNCHKVYGQYAKQTNLKFKLYDKQHEVKVHDRKTISPTLRVEQEMNMNYIRKRKETPIRIYTPADFLQQGWEIEVIIELLVQSQRIEFTADLGVEDSDSLMEAEIKILMGNKQFRKIVKEKATAKTFRKRVKVYSELQKKKENENLSDEISQLIEKKMNSLAGLNSW